MVCSREAAVHDGNITQVFTRWRRCSKREGGSCPQL